MCIPPLLIISSSQLRRAGAKGDVHALRPVPRGAGTSKKVPVMRRGRILSLFVEELLEEFGIFVVDILDTALLETAILLLLDVNGGGSQVANFRCLCHGLVLLFVRTTFCSVFSSKLVEFYSQKTDYALVTTETDFQFFYNGGVCLELQQLIETGALLVDGVSQLLEAPVFFIDNLCAVGGEDTLEFFRPSPSSEHQTKRE